MLTMSFIVGVSFVASSQELESLRARNQLHGQPWFPAAGKKCQFVCGTTKEEQMCRNIRTLFNFEPPATDDEIRASALQFVRKLSGFSHPSKANEPAFERAVDEVAEVARRLIDALQTSAPARDREVEAAKASARARDRFATG